MHRHSWPIVEITVQSNRNVELLPSSHGSWNAICNVMGGYDQMSSNLYDLTVTDSDGQEHTFKSLRLFQVVPMFPITGNFLSRA